MTVGAPQDKNAIDARAFGLAIQARDLFNAIANFNAFLAAKSTAELVALGYDESGKSEVSTLKSAFTQLDSLRQIATGATGGQTAANNYLFFSNKLVGPN